MSTIHFDAAELANIASALCDRYATKEDLAALLAEFSEVNTRAYNERYNAHASAWDAGWILSQWSLTGDLGRAIDTLGLLEYNCDGLMSDELAAKIGRLALKAARKMSERAAQLRGQLRWYEDKAAEDCAKAAAQPATKPKRGSRAA